MSSHVIAVRGAISVDHDIDEVQSMVSAVGRLMKELENMNGWEPQDLVSIQFTQTSDLRRLNAASALRRACPDYSLVPLFCAQEPIIENAPMRMVRVLVTWRGSSTPIPVYLGEASKLRPDLFGGE